MVVGDHSRALLAANMFDEDRPHTSSESSRGFLTINGCFQGVPLSIVSIGMGYPNMDIFVREARDITHGSMAIIRAGTCGSISETAAIGDLAIPSMGSVMVQRNYNYPFSFSNKSMVSINLTDAAFNNDDQPYLISITYSPDKVLTDLLLLQAKHEVGASKVKQVLNASSDSFYSSQGRTDDDFCDKNSRLILELKSRNVSTLEMETAQLFHLASCITTEDRRIDASAIQIVLANRLKNDLLLDMHSRHQLELTACRAAMSALAVWSEPEKDNN